MRTQTRTKVAIQSGDEDDFEVTLGDEDDFGVTFGNEDDFGVTQLTPVVIGEQVGERNVGPQVPEEGDYDEALSKICKIIINIQHRYQVPED